MDSEGNIEIEKYGKVGDLKKGWKYISSILRKNSEHSLIIASSRVTPLDGHLQIETSENTPNSYSILGIEDLENFETADERAYNALKKLTKKLKRNFYDIGQIKIVDKTPRGKENQLEIGLK